MLIMFNVSKIYFLSSSNFNIGKILRLWEEAMLTIIIIMYV